MTPLYDVIQIGYGPVSQALALMLGRQGRSVAVCERWETRYPLPRAVCIDHELYRVLSANGLGAVLPQISHPGSAYQWFNADWKELLVIDWSAPSISGGSEVNFVHQPTLEESLDLAVAEQTSVERMLGWEAVRIDQDETLAHVTLRHFTTGEERRISARYVIGCDGANSMVRETIGGSREDRGFGADWLVIDAVLKEGVTIEELGIPAAGQYCNPTRPTTIVPAGVREGRLFRRWEFMRLPGETVEELEREENVWKLLSQWATPDDIELVRYKVYNFRSLLAERWRDRRVLIAGDAAHVMPPFIGQGMCSGMRDAWNLAWKLELILDGKASDALLDSYQTERLPHVSQLIDMSIYLGKIICIPDAQEAALRDEAFLTGTMEPMPPFPSLVDGLLNRDDNGRVSAGAGLLAPHVEIERKGQRKRLDDMLGGGFLIVAQGDPEALLDAETRAALSLLGVNYLSLRDRDSAHYAHDCDGRYQSFLSAQGWSAAIIRPDFYVYGGARLESGLDHLAGELIADLKAAGVRFSTANAKKAFVTV